MDIWTTIVKVFPRTYTYRILYNFWDMLVLLYPYVLAGILIVALLQGQVHRLPRLRFLRSESTANILAATVLGMVAPLSVYIAVPMSATLMASGIPGAAVVAFLFACPLIDPNLFILTYGALGWQMALARVLASFALGFGAGLAYKKLSGRFPLRPREKLLSATQAGAGCGLKSPRSLGSAIRRQSIFIAKVFGISLLLSAAIKALVDPQFVQGLFGDSGNLSILLAIGLGIPFYQCGGASIPIMQALYELGMSGGAILAFFISGPATKLPALYAFSEGYGWRFLSLFLLYTLAGAFAAGLIFNMFFHVSRF
ncbi:MAG: permease [Gemmatimonadota bacterium]|nr:permease [Gemmatimonadota bacterium]